MLYTLGLRKVYIDYQTFNSVFTMHSSFKYEVDAGELKIQFSAAEPRDEDMDIDEQMLKKVNEMPKFVPWVEK